MLSPDSVCRGVVKPCRSRRIKSKNILLKQWVGTMLPLTVASLYLGQILHHDDRRRFKIEEALTSPAVYGLRSAVMNFIVGGIIRRMQARNSGQVPKRYSFIIHTESARDAHRW